MKFLKKINKNADSLLHLDNKINIFPKCKRSQSEVISTILLVLIAIVAITTVSMFIISFVNSQIEKSKCIELFNPPIIEIRNNPLYTCYNPTDNIMRVQVHFSETKSSLEGFVITIGGADSKTYKILNGLDGTSIGVTMFTEDDPILVLPADNTEKTYLITLTVTTPPENLQIHPILKGGRVCESSSRVSPINVCK